MIPDEPLPPTTDVGEKAKLDKVAGVRVRVALLPPFAAPTAAVIVSSLVADTADDVIVKDFALTPAGMVMVVGYPTEESPPDIDTTSPDGPAGLVSLTTAVADEPPSTEVGVIVRLLTCASPRTTVPDLVELPRVAVKVSECEAETGEVPTVKVFTNAPAGTVTEVGWLPNVSPPEIATTAPEGPAGLESRTVAVVEEPPFTGEGEKVRLVIVGVVIVRVPTVVDVPSVAVIDSTFVADTGDVVTENDFALTPAGTVTEAGSSKELSPPENVTTSPEGPAGVPSLTTALAEKAPITELGVNVRLVSFAGVTVSTVVFVDAPNVAVIDSFLEADTAVVVTVKVLTDVPAGTVTVAG